MLWLILGLVLFLGVHSLRIVAPRWRLDTIRRIGENGWKGIYSLALWAHRALIGVAPFG